MIINNHENSTFNYLQTFMVILIIMIVVTPFLLMISHGNNRWVIVSSIIWVISSSIIFHPFVQHVYPQMITKIGFFLLTTILLLVTTALSLTLIAILLPYRYIYNILINISFNQLLIVAWGYIFIVSSLISKLKLSIAHRD